MRIALYSVLSLVLTACAPQYGVEVKEGSLAESVADAPPAPADEGILIVGGSVGQGPGHGSQYIDGRIALSLGNLARQDEVAVQDPADHVSHWLFHVRPIASQHTS